MNNSTTRYIRTAPISSEAVHREFEKAINQKDLEGLISLYEETASLVLADGRVFTGKEAIGSHFSALLQLHPKMSIDPPKMIDAQGLAVLIADWRLTGISSSGEQFEEWGRTYDVIRRQNDGTWRIVFDSPWGGKSERGESER